MQKRVALPHKHCAARDIFFDGDAPHLRHLAERPQRLKEGRPLVLVPRETPLSRVHLRNLAEASSLGMTIVPPMLTFYSGVTTLAQQMDQIIGKALRFFGIEYDRLTVWQG